LCLEKWIENALHEERRKSLKELCHIRWIEWYQVFDDFPEFYIAVFSSLELIANNTI